MLGPSLAFVFGGDENPPWVQWLLPLGLVMIVGSIVISLRNRRRRGAGKTDRANPTAREILERSKQTRGMQSDLEELMVEIERLTRRFASQLDAKTQRLEQLIDEADSKIARLERLSGPDAAASPPAADAGPTELHIDPTSRSVYELADQGLEPVEIARRLSETPGKVELILALRRV